MSLENVIPDERRLSLASISVASVLAGLACIQLVAWNVAGAFDYPLDDVYIHLAVAEQILSGGYGVNAGEFASAASSPIYPLLLLPVAGLEAQRFVPLMWNIVALAVCGWLWGRILMQSGYDTRHRAFGVAAALIVPLAINLPGVAYTGMEHALHSAASLAVVYGLLKLLDDEELSPWLLAGIVLGPLIRFEGLALSLLAAGVLMVRGHRLAGGLAGVTAVAGIAAFMGFLVSLGLDPLPNSVQAKLGDGSNGSFMSELAQKMKLAFVLPGWSVMAATVGSVLLLPVLVPSVNATPRRWLVRVILLALLAHLLLGKVGWMNRYENYILVAAVASLLALAAEGGRAARLTALAPVLVATVVYGADHLKVYPFATRAVHLQQGQMARLAKDFWGRPVAVNDLGWVAWGNPSYVLDLWGLGSSEALKTRTSDPAPGWAAPLAERAGVEFAMIYDNWLRQAVGDDWVRLGTLSLEGHPGILPISEVSFYATTPLVVERLSDAISDWAVQLPEGAWFRADDAGRQ